MIELLHIPISKNSFFAKLLFLMFVLVMLTQNATVKLYELLRKKGSELVFRDFRAKLLLSLSLEKQNWHAVIILKTYFYMGNPVIVLVKRTDKTNFSDVSEIKYCRWVLICLKRLPKMNQIIFGCLYIWYWPNLL